MRTLRQVIIGLLIILISVPFLQGCPRQGAFHSAVVEGNQEAVETLIAKGADVNAKDKEGMTPLHQAASNGQQEIVETLIAKGANVNAKNKEGRLHSFMRQMKAIKK